MSKLSYLDLCKNWGIDPDENRIVFEWLKADPRDEQGRLTREVGMRGHGSVAEKLERRHTRTGTHFYTLSAGEFGYLGEIFLSGCGAVQVSAMDFNF